MKLEGKVAIVTGSARGIGRAIALRLARLGADIVIHDINLRSSEEVGEELTANTVVDEVRALGRRSIGIEADVTNKQAVNTMFDKIMQEFGHLDILVNNVGGGQGKMGPLVGDSASVSEEDVRLSIDRNLISQIFCCQAAIPLLVAQKSGIIVNIASYVGLTTSPVTPFAGQCAYAPAKAGVIQYTRVLADELGPHGIRVNCITPACIVTSRTLGLRRISAYKVGYDKLMETRPLRREGHPEDVAKVVEFLCTDLSDYVTGQCIRVDGGMCLF